MSSDASVSAPGLRDKVRAAYSAAAEHPSSKHAFPLGRAFAENAGYPGPLLATLPAVSVEAFAGVSNVSLFADLPEGAVVLDLGCGAGLDALIAARRVGPSGKVIGVDYSPAMLDRARRAAAEAGVANVDFRRGDAEKLPLEDNEIDVALVNGIFNLNPAREQIFQELARVLRPGGMAYAAELILSRPLPQQEACETDWFAWIAGAKEAGAFLSEFQAAGFSDATLLRTLRNDRTKNPLVLAAEVRARR